MKKKLISLVFALAVSSAILQVNSAFVTGVMANESAESIVAPTGKLTVGRAKLRTAAEMQAAEAAVLAAGKAPEPVEIPFRPTMSESDYRAAKAAANAQVSSPGDESLAPPFVKGGTNFDGANSVEAGGFRPPDTHGAIGRNHFVEITNSQIAVYLRDGTRVRRQSLASFFGYTLKTIFDPRVVYDRTWNRWIASAEAFPESETVQRQFLAISKTDDPEGDFFIYRFDVISASGDFWDYPQLGMDQDSIIVTANLFGATAFKGASMFAVAKARLYNGLGFSVPLFGGLDATLAPPIVLDQNCKTFLVAASASPTITKYTLTESSHPSCTRLTKTTIPVAAYAVPPDASQPGTTDKLDTLDRRFVNASTQNGTSLWNIHTIADRARPAPRWYEFNTTTNTVVQSGIIHASSTSHDFNASIAANTIKDVFVTYSSTLQFTSTNAQVRYSGRVNADPVNVIPAGFPLFTSPTFYNPSAATTERWGDYSAVTLDPRNQRHAWIVNEKINTTTVWGSRIGKIGQ